MLPYFKKKILLTGTPIPNGMLNIWSQIFLLDNGERLENSYFKYLEKYYTKNTWLPYSNYTIKKGSEEIIEDKIKDISIYQDTKGNIELPPLLNNYIFLEFEKDTQELYNKLENDRIIKYENEDIYSESAGGLISKLLQFTAGAIYKNDFINKEFININNTKLNALAELIEENEGKNLLIFYWFQSDKIRILERFKELEPREIKSQEDYKEWNAGKIKLLLGHPLSLGHGLNLQSGGNIIIWYSLPYDLEVYLQANKRLYRSGQTQAVIIHHLIIKNTIETAVLNALETKSKIQDNLLRYLKLENINEVIKIDI
jgi:SNF2 family DNA or RNA helicase